SGAGARLLRPLRRDRRDDPNRGAALLERRPPGALRQRGGLPPARDRTEPRIAQALNDPLSRPQAVSSTSLRRRQRSTVSPMIVRQVVSSSNSASISTTVDNSRSRPSASPA